MDNLININIIHGIIVHINSNNELVLSTSYLYDDLYKLIIKRYITILNIIIK